MIELANSKVTLRRSKDYHGGKNTTTKATASLIDRFIVEGAEPGTIEYSREITYRYIGRMRSKKNKGYAQAYLAYIEAGRHDDETLIPLYGVTPRTAYSIRMTLRHYVEMIRATSEE